jgi:hypothetical protein
MAAACSSKTCILEITHGVGGISPYMARASAISLRCLPRVAAGTVDTSIYVTTGSAGGGRGGPGSLKAAAVAETNIIDR